MALWLDSASLVLASQSATRSQLLASAGVPVEAVPAGIDERAIEREAASRDPATVALVLAEAKARAVAALRPGRLVLGADQTLTRGAQAFNKPADRAAARAQLQALRGRSHTLTSGFALIRDGERLAAETATATLRMRDFSDAFLDRYLDAVGAAASSSVGGYQLEGLGIHLFERVEGDHSTILGLPLLELLVVLRRLGCVAG